VQAGCDQGREQQHEKLMHEAILSSEAGWL